MNNRYLNAREMIFDLKDELKNSDKANAKLMATVIELTAQIEKLTDEVDGLNKVVVQAGDIMRRLDKERLKVVQSKRDLAERYGKVCQLISDMDAESTKMSFCRQCRWKDPNGVCCTRDVCSFEVMGND